MKAHGPKAKTYGYEEYARLPDDGVPTELVRGMVVREPQPQYGHGRVQAQVIYHISLFIEESSLPVVCVGPVGAILGRQPDTVRGADVSVIRAERLPPDNRVGFLDGAPDLAIEIVSPSNRAAHIREKVTNYLAAGASCVWLIDPLQRTAVIHSRQAQPRQLHETGALMCDDVLPGLRLGLKEVFGAAN